MKVLVTGGAGYIGTHTLVELLSLDYEVAVIDDLSNSKKNSLAKVKKLAKKNFQFFNVNLTDASSVITSFEKFVPDTVIHFAGLKSPFSCKDNTVSFYEQNVGGTIQLLKAMEHINCNRIVFSSSAIVYGDSRILPHSEKHTINPQNSYGHTKAAIENLLYIWANEKIERSAIALRYFNPIGAHPSGLIGEDPVSPPANLVPRIIEVAKGVSNRLEIFGENFSTRDGTGERDYIHVLDLAKAHCNALNFLQKSQNFDVYNIGLGKGVTVRELIKIFEKISGKLIPTTIGCERASDISSSIADVTKANQKLGWFAEYDVLDACKTAWEWEKNRI